MIEKVFHYGVQGLSLKNYDIKSEGTVIGIAEVFQDGKYELVVKYRNYRTGNVEFYDTVDEMMDCLQTLEHEYDAELSVLED